MTDSLQEWEVYTLKGESTGRISSLTPEWFHRKKVTTAKIVIHALLVGFFFPPRNKCPFKMFSEFVEAFKTTLHLNSNVFFLEKKILREIYLKFLVAVFIAAGSEHLHSYLEQPRTEESVRKNAIYHIKCPKCRVGINYFHV